MITQEEYAKLKQIKADGFEWIARDKNGELYVFSEKPIRDGGMWNIVDRQTDWSMIKDEKLFPDVLWEDNFPTKIEDFMNEYKPSQNDKDDKEKVTIPKFVANWIEQHKQGNHKLLDALIENYNKHSGDNELYHWLNDDDNICDFLCAWQYGYEVEQEKLYTVKLANGDCLYKSKTFETGWTNGYLNYESDPDFQLTKAEIEAIEPALMQIAKEVKTKVTKEDNLKGKIEIPPCVADWIEEVKELERRFKLECLCDTTRMPDDVYYWLDRQPGTTDVLARAWLDGYRIVVEMSK